MYLAVVGGRNFNNYELLRTKLDQLQIGKIISGGAQGADRLAEKYAQEKGIPLQVFPADWSRYGRAAGPIRNEEIVKNANALIAFWDGTSPGTKSSIALAQKYQRPYEIVYI